MYKTLKAVPYSVVWEDILFRVCLVEEGHFFRVI